jgi:L-alanine-DL-glutamate epimerase-like enolase superfamily enzyme
MKIERIRTYHLRAELTAAEAFALRACSRRAVVQLDRTANPFREGLAAEPFKRAGAIIEVPQRPGLGLEVDRSVVERHAVTTGEKKR